MRSQTKTISAPVGGWNAREVLANMPEFDAVTMVNAFPNTTDVQIRKGSEDYVTGIATGTPAVSEKVETLAAYNFAIGSKLFASTVNAIYDVTSKGVVGAAVVSTGITLGQWQHTNYKVPGGNHWLMMVNGKDAPQFYNGTAWAAVTASSTPSITGVTTTDIVGINEFKRRIWLIEDDSSNVWYLPTDSVGGVATRLDIGPVFGDGGYLMAMGTWTLDAGIGLDDHAVFISSKGEVAIYAGTDPASADTWALVGVFRIGSPVGRRCFIKYGGDLLVISQGGIVPLSNAILSSEISQSVAVSDKIRLAMTESVRSYQQNFGWQILQYPNANMLMVNVPVSTTIFRQYCMNTITGSWCQFRDWNASCWELFKDEIYFGTLGKVVKAWTGSSDNGSNITADVIPAFNYFGSFTQKRFTMARPIFSATGTPSLLMGINVDFSVQPPIGTPTLAISGSSKWDTAKWDESSYGGDYEIHRNWQTVNGVGFSASLHMQMTTNSDTVKWLSSDIVFEDGSVI